MADIFINKAKFVREAADGFLDAVECYELKTEKKSYKMVKSTYE